MGTQPSTPGVQHKTIANSFLKQHGRKHSPGHSYAFDNPRVEQADRAYNRNASHDQQQKQAPLLFLQQQQRAAAQEPEEQREVINRYISTEYRDASHDKRIVQLGLKKEDNTRNKKKRKKPDKVELNTANTTSGNYVNAIAEHQVLQYAREPDADEPPRQHLQQQQQQQQKFPATDVTGVPPSVDHTHINASEIVGAAVANFPADCQPQEQQPQAKVKEVVRQRQLEKNERRVPLPPPLGDIQQTPVGNNSKRRRKNIDGTDYSIDHEDSTVSDGQELLRAQVEEKCRQLLNSLSHGSSTSSRSPRHRGEKGGGLPHNGSYYGEEQREEVPRRTPQVSLVTAPTTITTTASAPFDASPTARHTSRDIPIARGSILKQQAKTVAATPPHTATTPLPPPPPPPTAAELSRSLFTPRNMNTKATTTPQQGERAVSSTPLEDTPTPLKDIAQRQQPGRVPGAPMMKRSCSSDKSGDTKPFTGSSTTRTNTASSSVATVTIPLPPPLPAKAHSATAPPEMTMPSPKANRVAATASLQQPPTPISALTPPPLVADKLTRFEEIAPSSPSSDNSSSRHHRHPHQQHPSSSSSCKRDKLLLSASQSMNAATQTPPLALLSSSGLQKQSPTKATQTEPSHLSANLLLESSITAADKARPGSLFKHRGRLATEKVANGGGGGNSSNTSSKDLAPPSVRHNGRTLTPLSPHAIAEAVEQHVVDVDPLPTIADADLAREGSDYRPKVATTPLQAATPGTWTVQRTLSASDKIARSLMHPSSVAEGSNATNRFVSSVDVEVAAAPASRAPLAPKAAWATPVTASPLHPVAKASSSRTSATVMASTSSGTFSHTSACSNLTAPALVSSQRRLSDSSWDKEMYLEYAKESSTTTTPMAASATTNASTPVAHNTRQDQKPPAPPLITSTTNTTTGGATGATGNKSKSRGNITFLVENNSGDDTASVESVNAPLASPSLSAYTSVGDTTGTTRGYHEALRFLTDYYQCSSTDPRRSNKAEDRIDDTDSGTLSNDFYDLCNIAVVGHANTGNRDRKKGNSDNNHTEKESLSSDGLYRYDSFLQPPQ